MKTAFLTVFKNHDRIVKSINQRKNSKEQLNEGYLTTQVAFSYLKIERSLTMSEKSQWGQNLASFLRLLALLLVLELFGSFLT